MRLRPRLCLIVFFASLLLSPQGEAARFTPEQRTVSVSGVRAGATGYMLTVLRGTKPEKIPVKIVNVIPQSAKGEVSSLILLRIMSKTTELARGMSGSPVYIGGRLAGAVSAGWSFADHKLAIVTPIDDMCAVFDRDGVERRGKAPLASVSVSGLSATSAAILERTVGFRLNASPAGPGGELPVEMDAAPLRPGDSVAALLAWGDVEIAATGAVTATARDGRFLAFGHPFLKKGGVGYPAARAYVHETVDSREFPFKLASPTSIVGSFAQDREAGLGGRFGMFAQSIAASFSFSEMGHAGKDERNFRVMAEPYMSAKLLEGIYAGLIEDAWGRRGQGTMSVTLRVEGRGIGGDGFNRNSWTRSDIFYSDEDVGAAAVKQASQIMNAVLTQPFSDTMPLAFRIDAEACEEPYALLIEDVEVQSNAKPGDDLPVKVKLRPWRGQAVNRDFTLKVPEGASGVCELIVRGGGVHPLPQLAIEGGWKSIDSLNLMLREIGALDANNELYVELLSDTIADAIKKAANREERDDKEPELLPEEKEYLSETKERRIREGTLRVFRSDRLVDGMMKRLVTIDDAEELNPSGKDRP